MLINLINSFGKLIDNLSQGINTFLAYQVVSEQTHFD